MFAAKNAFMTRPTNNFTLYASTQTGLSISTDGGNTFVTRTTANGLSENTILGVAVKGSTVFAATQGSGVCKSTNGGASFTRIPQATSGLAGSSNMGGPVIFNSRLFVPVYQGLSVSTNDGVSFTTDPNVSGVISKVSANVNPNVVFASAAGVYRSYDGQNFSFVSGTSGWGTVSGACQDGTNIYVGTSQYGMLVSQNSGSSWSFRAARFGTPGFPGNNVLGVAAKGLDVYACCTGNGFAVSRDGGTTFTTLSQIGAFPRDVLLFGESTVLVASGSGIFISHDKGNTFVNRTTTHGLANDFVYQVIAV